MTGGWQGKILTVHLTSGDIGPVTPDAEDYRMYIGGAGLAARILYEMIPHDADPLGPENVVAILAGPVTGTRFPGAGRVEICALSPLTGGWGEASMGGFLGAALKRAGWDGVLFEGAANSPSYLLVDDARAELVDAADLWGLDTYETEAILHERHPGFEVACIGPAGENLCAMAGVAHRRGELAGRCGMGAALGSKRVKAVVVHGGGKVQVSDADVFNGLVSQRLEGIKGNPLSQMQSTQGTAGVTQMMMMMGDMPVRNWSGEIWQEGANGLSGPSIVSDILVKRTGCYACPIRCKAVVSVDEGTIHVTEGPGPEYETLGSLGTLLFHGNLAGVAKANELCNRLGLDTIGTGSTIAWAMEAFERGALTIANTDGVELTWGNTSAILKAIEAIGLGRGDLGSLLSLGSRRAAEKLGKGSEKYAMHVRGLDLPMHNPRVFHGLALVYAILPHGASHNEGGFNQRGANLSVEEWVNDTIETIRPKTVYNSAVLCSFTMGGTTMQFLADTLASVTGEPYTEEGLRQFADRTYLMRCVFNLRAGQTPASNVLPQRILEQMAERDPRWATDWVLALSVYYRLRGFDEKGYPMARALRDAGLGSVVSDMVLWGR